MIVALFCAYEATLHHCFRREDAHKAMSKEREEFRRTLEARLAEYHKSKEAYKKVKAIDLMFRTVWNNFFSRPGTRPRTSCRSCATNANERGTTD